MLSGASSGIGAATAILFSKMGANLSLSGRNMSNLEETANSCTKVTPDQKSPFLIQGIQKQILFLLVRHCHFYGLLCS